LRLPWLTLAEFMSILQLTLKRTECEENDGEVSTVQ